MTSGLRIGAAAMTSRGFKEAEFEKVINWIVDVLDHDDEEYAKEVRKEVVQLTRQFPAEAQI